MYALPTWVHGRGLHALQSLHPVLLPAACSTQKVIDKTIFIDKERLIDKFYEGDYENESVQVPENNNSSNKESNKEVSDFLSSEDSCDEWLP